MTQTAQQEPVRVQIVPRNIYKEVHDEIVANGGFHWQQEHPMKNWLVYALKEPATKRGSHVKLNSERKAWKATDETDLLNFCNLPADQGGPGYYKVLYYCDMDNLKEVNAFNKTVEHFKMQFRSDTPGNIDI